MQRSKTKLTAFSEKLLKAYGPQGWWPLLNHEGSNPTKTGAVRGYHPGDHSFPHNDHERFEICAGAILTQNTAWPNVENALRNLNEAGLLDPERITNVEGEKLRTLIRPAGYFNQKAKKLKLFSEFFISLNEKTPSREQLLDLWGVGPETADSILLYAYKRPEFVVDAYTRRVLAAEGFMQDAMTATYDDVKAYCVKNLPLDVEAYQEFHALLVERAKRTKSK